MNRFMSFAPERKESNKCKWYSDAHFYFEDIFEALTNAKNEVYITDWYLSPELYLKRPVGPNLN